MKRMSGFFLTVISVCLCAQAAGISSTASGGNWSDTLTWAGHKVPGASDDVIINGTVSVTQNASCRNMTLAEGAILQNGGSLGWVTLSAKGSVVNNGTIRDNPANYKFWIEIAGDITNNGIWIPTNTFLTSRQRQTISQKAETVFRGTIRKRDPPGATDTFALVAASDLVLNAEVFDGSGQNGGKTIWGILDMAGHNLTLQGGTKLFNTILKNTASVVSRDSSIIASCTFETPVALSGRATLTDSKVTFNDTVTVTDTLQNGGSLGWVTAQVQGTIINNGTIRNNPKNYKLWLDVAGNIINNGIWAPANTYLASRQPQVISQKQGTVFGSAIRKKDAPGVADTFPLVAGSDLVFDAEFFDGSGYKDGKYFQGILDMAGNSLTLQGGTRLFNTILRGTTTVFSHDSATLASCTFEEPATLAGRTTITDSKVSFNGSVTVADTRQNGGNLGWVTVQCKGGVVNNGLIRDNPKGYQLWLEIGSHITNSGRWTNKKTVLIDSVDQTIGLVGNAAIGSLVQLDALWPSGPYAWQKDGQPIAGTNRLLSLDSVTAAQHGVYRCKKGEEWSRSITIREGTATAVIAHRRQNPSTNPQLFNVWASTAGSPRVFFQAPHSCRYTISLYTAAGKRIFQQTGTATAGAHLIALASAPLPSGRYIARVEAANTTWTGALMVMR